MGEARAHGDRKALETLRVICSVLPESIETMTFGHPTVQAGKKRTFVAHDEHERPGMLYLMLKADRAEQARLVDGERFLPYRLGAKPGWTSMRVDAQAD